MPFGQTIPSSTIIASYDPSFFAPLSAVEDRHFWFRSRNRAIAAVIAPQLRELPSGYRVLEVGCGTGNVLRTLEQACRDGLVVGMDLFSEGLEHARLRSHCPLVQADLQAPPFRAGFDIIGLFDVLEHLADDAGALRGLRSMLQPGGRVVLTVPAHQWLWSYFDVLSCHQRRYSARQLRGALVSAGYAVEYLSPYMLSILPLMWLQRRLKPDPRAEGDLQVRPMVNRVLSWLLSLELPALARHSRLPAGASLVAVARRLD